MKTTKRIFACLLIVVMLASMLCVGAGAAATITINGTVGTTYKAYKVLDVEATTDGGNVTAILYTWADADYKAYADSTATTNGAYVTISDAAAFANAMLANPITMTTSAEITSGTSTSISLENGYYVMTSSANTIPFAFTVYGSSIVAPSTGNSTYIETNAINEKAELPAVAKTVNKTAFYIGETINYTTEITAKVGALNYVLHDSADNGIAIDTTSIVVTNEGATVTEGANTYSIVTATGDGCDFHIEFDQDFCDTLTTGETITVTYTGVLNENAKISGETNTNTTWLTHGTTGNLKTDEKEAKVTTYQLTVKKNDGTNPLAGATFSLYSNEACTDIVKFTTAGTNEYVLNTTAGTVTTFTTDDTGTFILKGLCGNYWLKETDAPAGYMITTEKTAVVLDKNVETTITNTPGNALPETGGIGTTVFYAVGGCLVLGALVILLMKKRTVA